MRTSPSCSLPKDFFPNGLVILFKVIPLSEKRWILVNTIIEVQHDVLATYNAYIDVVTLQFTKGCIRMITISLAQTTFRLELSKYVRRERERVR